MTDEAKGVKRADELGRLWWLIDAPLFVDRPLVDRLHDAVVWPELGAQETEKSTHKKIETAIAGQAEAAASGDLGLPKFIEFLAPKIEANAKLAGQASRQSIEETNDLTKGRRIENAGRRLNELALEYLKNYPNRLLFVDAPGGGYSGVSGPIRSEYVELLLQSPPRPLVFLDIKQGSPIFPTMIEMETGGFQAVYKVLEEQAKKAGHETTYPRDSRDLAKLKTYWGQLRTTFSSRDAMEALENACKDGRIGWIDFRLLFEESGATAHLHVVPAGAYHTGVFGYNFIHRGHKHGCRVVGSLKSGNDINVLAIYER